MGLFGRKSKEKKMFEKKLDELYHSCLFTEDLELRLKFCDELLRLFDEKKDSEFPEYPHPDENQAYDFKSACLYQLERYEESLEYCEKAISINNGFISNPRKAYLLNYLERYEESLEWLNLHEKERDDRAARSPNNFSDERYGFGDVADKEDGVSFFEPKVIAMFKVGKSKEEILTYIDNLIAHVDQNSYYNNNINRKVECLNHLQKLEDSVEMMFNVITLTPEMIDEIKKFVRNRKDNGEELLPEDVPIVIFNRAVSEYFAGAFSSACEGFKQVLEHDPDDDEAKNFLKKCNKKLSED
jgi:tetratricopeptide (TPR) repeat protein